GIVAKDVKIAPGRGKKGPVFACALHWPVANARLVRHRACGGSEAAPAPPEPAARWRFSVPARATADTRRRSAPQGEKARKSWLRSSHNKAKIRCAYSQLCEAAGVRVGNWSMCSSDFSRLKASSICQRSR